MTSVSDILSTLIEEADSFDELKAAAFESHGVYIDGLYCLHTGKQIGSFDRTEIQFAIEDEITDSQEELIDALVVRTVASMRPSPALNKPDHITIRQLAARRPIDTLAYLLNRLYGTRDLLTKRNGELSFGPLLDRIKTHSSLVTLHFSFDLNLTPWTHWLLELDSKTNLHDLTPPLFEKDRLGKWIITKTGKPLIEVLESHEDASLLKAFESWVFDLLGVYAKRDSQATREANWVRGNSLTKAAYIQSWLDNPGLARKVEIANNKAQAAYNAKAKPGRPKSEKTRKLEDRVKQTLDLLAGVIDGKVDIAPVTAKPVLKLNLNALKKKES